MIFNKKPSNVHHKIAFNLIGFLQRACPKIYLHIFVKTVTTSRAPLSKKVEEECWKGVLHEGASRQWQLHFNFVRMYIHRKIAFKCSFLLGLAMWCLFRWLAVQ